MRLEIMRRRTAFSQAIFTAEQPLKGKEILYWCSHSVTGPTTYLTIFPNLVSCRHDTCNQKSRVLVYTWADTYGCAAPLGRAEEGARAWQLVMLKANQGGRMPRVLSSMRGVGLSRTKVVGQLWLHRNLQRRQQNASERPDESIRRSCANRWNTRNSDA